jgi:hypothetical protein
MIFKFVVRSWSLITVCLVVTSLAHLQNDSYPIPSLACETTAI